MSTFASPSPSIQPGLDALQREIEGAVITQWDGAYDDARRVWNGMIDRRPLAIVRAASTADIAPTIRAARDLDRRLAIRTFVYHARELTWRGTAFDVHHMGGAFGRVPENATPFPNRSARYWLNIYGFWSDPADDERRTGRVRQFADDMAPHASGGLYLNFLGQERDPVAARTSALAVYGPDKLERLVALKRQYDPDNVFRLNHNIPPG